MSEIRSSPRRCEISATPLPLPPRRPSLRGETGREARGGEGGGGRDARRRGAAGRASSSRGGGRGVMSRPCRARRAPSGDGDAADADRARAYRSPLAPPGPRPTTPIGDRGSKLVDAIRYCTDQTSGDHGHGGLLKRRHVSPWFQVLGGMELISNLGGVIFFP